MSAVIYDTHGFVKKLKAVGFTEEQAEVIAEEQKVLIDEHLATKRDLKELEQSLVIKLGGMLIVAITVLSVLMKIL
ncbi:hypothetical protein QCB44_10395 [Thiomicrorhabdus sp. zzn3]|jgi:hypothetical protein|uniref:hypothetical protein n=1 Tax=Thiomicrorhabdus sp. zzn3 TaxID=3039775 RepID=UPI00243725C9|nr:hypothetical protein [Thiomicrorhabdus sp. zzn3]MDG6779115.1 hypothetical protein [Thiomicrorhabdus sp. zzn3]